MLPTMRVLTGLIVLTVVVVGVWWWRRRRRRTRLISIVALLREPVTFDSAVLAHVAGKVWQADLGDGSSAGPDGFVAGTAMFSTIVHAGRMILVNAFSSPYVPDVEKVAETIADLRIRQLFREHTAWFSCDVMGIDGSTSEAEIVECYRKLGPLFADLLDENCLLIFLPDLKAAYPINEETDAALRSSDPVQALIAEQTVPVVEVQGDDPLMITAVETARSRWPTFLEAYERDAGTNFAVKAPISRDGHTEYIWLTVTSIEGEKIYGKLANEPAALGKLRLGSKVSVPVDDLNDWSYVDGNDQLQGLFTVSAVQEAARRRSRGT